MKQSISPYQPAGRVGFVCTFFAPSGKRVTRGLGTKSRAQAKMICMELENLSESAPMPQDAQAAGLVSPTAWRIWFGEAAPEAPGMMGNTLEQLRTQVLGLNSALIEARLELETLRPYVQMYEDLSRSIEGQRAIAAKNSPTLGEVRADYERSVASLSRGGSLHKTFIRRFIEQLGEDRKLVSIKPGEIQAYIAEDAKKHPREAIRPKKVRALASKFFGWCAVNHSIPNPMDRVPSQRIQADKDIQWHSLEEIEAVIRTQNVYWKALIGTLAYAGLSAHELRGLESKDVIESSGRRFLRIAPTDERRLKTAKRRRNVEISKRLAVLIDAHIAAQGESRYLFPSSQRSRGEMWTDDSLTHHLGQHLPDGMDALSLRRTFGSLLIRSGKTAEQVAAAMGNSAAIVTRHYGRILGGEVEIDF